METPTTHAHIGGVTLLAPESASFGFERFRREVEERLPQAPRFRKTLREVRFGLDKPYFVDRPFHIDDHVRRIALDALKEAAGIGHAAPLRSTEPEDTAEGAAREGST